jgi:hypothetical protein
LKIYGLPTRAANDLIALLSPAKVCAGAKAPKFALSAGEKKGDAVRRRFGLRAICKSVGARRKRRLRLTE